MRFLCLHGRGTNSKILEIQSGTDLSINGPPQKKKEFILTSNIAKIRDELNGHQFVFIDGMVATEASEEAAALAETFYGYLPSRVNDVGEVQDAINALVDYVTMHGPFDGVLGFSEGAIMAATLLVEDARNPFADFKCGILFSSGLPLDPNLLRGGAMRCIDPDTDGVVINVPTAIIVEEGLDRLRNLSPLAPLLAQTGDFQQALVRICDQSSCEVVWHNLGHKIPWSKSTELDATLRSIERTISRAQELDS
ncbi:Serine hydrolase FSH [Penicillium alfredii]|uniref:Serine hydrolase FSH n=1 Tax=Penicillium alfredii TaxID=1506179 RepID=A0A9W9FM21_9EURO|nr:Serine hydrolase FSH [Penicillium alfredii]KAJ5102442.1 Serine hydrolase FSH [Penicillium alfredii]